MASESNSQQLMREGQETAGQAQERTEGVMDQAGTFLQQTGEQVINMAAGAADAVKSTLGMNSANNPSGATAAGASGADKPGFAAPAAPAAVSTGAPTEAPAAAASAAPTAAASAAPGGSNASNNPGSAAH